MEENIIHFIMTGGTIDSHYDGAKDTVVPNEHSIIPNYLKSMKLDYNLEFTEICMKDSREISQDDLEKILHTIENSPHKKFIISQGTYTMSDTARYLKANMEIDDKTIILTGSLYPMENFALSDGPFNLGYSIAKVIELPAGVYICMNAQIFSPEEVAKNIREGKFYSIFGEKAKINQ